MLQYLSTKMEGARNGKIEGGDELFDREKTRRGIQHEVRRATGQVEECFTMV
jgi:hypothetical protein